MFVTGNILQPLIDLNEAVLRFFHEEVGFGWGLSIICLTIAIRLLILPLTYKQVRSMQDMQRFSPEIKRIRDRYSDDKQRQNEELMKLYKDHGFNPLGSCLPLLLQLPFFFSLYWTLQPSGDVAQQIRDGADGLRDFLWMPDLTAKLTDHTGALIVTVILYVGSQLGSSYVSSLSVQDKNQRRLLFIFPFVFVPIVINFPAGLLVYWITTNFFTIAQQLAVKKFLPPKDATPIGEDKAGGKGDDGDGAGAKSSRKRPPSKPKAATAAVAESDARPGKKKPKAATASNGSSDGGPRKAPPRSPRKKKKRTGRRR
jgi:YidC/Oxa1 family membrane protein insertase